MVRLETGGYARNLKAREGAERYASKYRRSLQRRISTALESRLLRALLDAAGRTGRLLDMPCGAGRISRILGARAEDLWEADFSPSMLALCREEASGQPGAERRRFIRASAFHLPFRDRAFDGTVSIRLSHHIANEDGRLAHLREILRVSRRYAIFSFFSSRSLKNRWRSLWWSLGSRRRAKYSVEPRIVEREAAAAGFRVACTRRISRVFSGHVFVLVVRACADG